MTTVNVSSLSGRTVAVSYLGPYTGSGALSIGTVDTDDAVTQYQQAVTIPLTNFSESIDSVTLNGTSCSIQSQVVGTSVTVDFPGDLATGSYTLSISGVTESATKTINYTQTHQYTSPVGDVDSNSLFSSPTLITVGTYHRIVTGPTNGTLDAATAESQSLWGNDVADIYTPNEGFTGDDSVDIEVLFNDGTTDIINVTIAVEDAVDTTPDPFTVTPLANQPLDSYVEFAPIEVTGVDAGEDIPVSVSGASVEYAVDTGSGYGGFTSTTTNVQLGYFVKPRIRTSDIGSTEVTGNIDIGGVSSGLSATTVAAVPQSIPVIGTPTTTKNSVSASFTYSGGDATGFEARIGNGSWTSVTSPLTISGLSASFTGTLEVRAVNATGAGSADSMQFTTDALEPPVGVISFGTPSKTDSTITQPYNYSASDQTGFEQSINGGSWESSTSPVSLSGLPESTFVNISVRPVNADGTGQTYTTSVQTNAAPDTTPPTISIADVSTRDLTPTITGFCDDATSITLVVTGVGTYNPENNQGTFSVQLPELTVGTYEMTLDAEDSLGNASEQQTATLTILEPLPPRGNAFGLRDMNPSIAVVTLMSNDGGAFEMDEFGRFTTTNAYSVVDVDMDGIQRKVLVKADGRPIKPFYKVNWQILD